MALRAMLLGQSQDKLVLGKGSDKKQLPSTSMTVMSKYQCTLHGEILGSSLGKGLPGGWALPMGPGRALLKRGKYLSIMQWAHHL